MCEHILETKVQLIYGINHGRWPGRKAEGRPRSTLEGFVSWCGVFGKSLSILAAGEGGRMEGYGFYVESQTSDFEEWVLQEIPDHPPKDFSCSLLASPSF